MTDEAELQRRRANQRRHLARRLAMQALYQWQLTGQSAREVVVQFRSNEDYLKADQEYFDGLVNESIAQFADLEEELKPFLSRDFKFVDPVERAVLLIAVLEFKSHLEIPYRVVINEAVAMTKKFGATDAHKFVNGVLDQLSKKLRGMEIGAQSGN